MQVYKHQIRSDVPIKAFNAPSLYKRLSYKSSNPEIRTLKKVKKKIIITNLSNNKHTASWPHLVLLSFPLVVFHMVGSHHVSTIPETYRLSVYLAKQQTQHLLMKNWNPVFMWEGHRRRDFVVCSPNSFLFQVYAQFYEETLSLWAESVQEASWHVPHMILSLLSETNQEICFYWLHEHNATSS